MYTNICNNMLSMISEIVINEWPICGVWCECIEYCVLYLYRYIFSFSNRDITANRMHRCHNTTTPINIYEHHIE
jgi:hypothetical protein